jgi:hypothetical protein
MGRQLPKQLLRMIEALDEDQLHALYHVVAQRLQLAQKAHALTAMSRFHVLDRVSFVHNGKQYEGTVTRLNQKTISIVFPLLHGFLGHGFGGMMPRPGGVHEPIRLPL